MEKRQRSAAFRSGRKMKFETLYLLVRVMVHTDHARRVDVVSEVEAESRVSMSDTANVNILETEILLSRVHNQNVHRLASAEII